MWTELSLCTDVPSSLRKKSGFRFRFFPDEGGDVCTQANGTRSIHVNIKVCCFIACVASFSVLFRSKERGRRVKDRAKNGASKRLGRGIERKVGSRSISLAAKTENPVLLPNQTETLATQACCFINNYPVGWCATFCWGKCQARFPGVTPNPCFDFSPFRVT